MTTVKTMASGQVIWQTISLTSTVLSSEQNNLLENAVEKQSRE